MEDDKSPTTERVEESIEEEGAGAESELESMDVSFDDAEDDEDEDTETEQSDTADDDAESADDEQESEEVETPDKEEKEQPADPKAEQKRHNDEMARRRIAEREAREQAKREAQLQFVNEAKDPHDIALRQLQVDAYNNRVQGNINQLRNDIDRAQAHIDLFKVKDPAIRETLLEAVDDFEAIHVKKDRNGDPVEVTGDLFTFLQKKADSITRLTGIRERAQKEAKARTKARTTALPSRMPKEPKKDPDLEGFDEEASRW